MEEEPKSKAHRKRHSGPKAEKKKAKKKNAEGGKNPKAFTYKSAIKAARSMRRTLDKNSKKHRLPRVDRTPLEPPPVCVAVVGPPKVGKSTLIRCLVKNYTRQGVTTMQGPITVVSGGLQVGWLGGGATALANPQGPQNKSVQGDLLSGGTGFSNLTCHTPSWKGMRGSVWFNPSDFHPAQPSSVS